MTSSAVIYVSTPQTSGTPHTFLIPLCTFDVILSFFHVYFISVSPSPLPSFLPQVFIEYLLCAGTLIPNWLVICLKARWVLDHSYIIQLIIKEL